jgi:serine beta-lactamase-like protein LACTB
MRLPSSSFLPASWVWPRAVLSLLAGSLVERAAGESSSRQLSEAIRQTRHIIAKDASKVPGLAVAVAFEGKIVWSEGFGYADLESKRPVSPSTTRFRIASVSKPLTAAGLLRLVERGEVDLDAPVQRYVLNFPVKKEGAITTRLLAGHLAGIRNYKSIAEAFRNEPFATVQAGLAIFKDDPLVAPPGEEFHYTTYGYSLIGAVMESAAQRDYLDLMRIEVLTPLGMQHTRPDRSGVADPDLTRFYKGSRFGGFRPEVPVDCSYKWPGGGFLSTAEDLVIFGAALVEPGFLKEESLAQLFTPQRPKKAGPSSYGIGWGIVKNRLGRTFYCHSGDGQGATTFLMILPKQKIVIAVLCNLSRAPLQSREDLQLLAKCFDGLTTQSSGPSSLQP